MQVVHLICQCVHLRVLTVLKDIANSNGFSIAGGGDTIAVLNQINAINNFNFISTAGGAFLEFLEGKELPGIKALN